jgi:hypothetical protein
MLCCLQAFAEHHNASDGQLEAEGAEIEPVLPTATKGKGTGMHR